MFRKQAKAFSADHIALKLAKESLEDGFCCLEFLEQVLTILPFEHAEDKDCQEKMKELADKLYEEASEVNKGYFSSGLMILFRYAESVVKYAKSHYDTVMQFGRYPHRNETLGRESTPEEIEYLKNADTYGQ